MEYHEIADDAKKLLALKEHCENIKILICTLPLPPPQMDGENHIVAETNYAKTKRKLNLQLGSKTNVQFSRFKINELYQKKEETVNVYTACIREQSKFCNFEEIEYY